MSWSACVDPADNYLGRSVNPVIRGSELEGGPFKFANFGSRNFRLSTINN
jgi:hypothetical protein